MGYLDWIYSWWGTDELPGPARNIPEGGEAILKQIRENPELKSTQPLFFPMTQSVLSNAIANLRKIIVPERQTDFQPRDGVLGEIHQFFKKNKKLNPVTKSQIEKRRVLFADDDE